MCAGMDRIDPKELQSMRHQLEDAQRWNASLQARLGAIQNRGGGVGGANDGGKIMKSILLLFHSSGRWKSICFRPVKYLPGDTLSFIGDQTSYMSICIVDGQDDGLALLSAQELRQKVRSFSH